jgi:hypothetical protein
MERVAAHIGDSRSDSFVFIRIKQEKERLPFTSHVFGLNSYLPALGF